MILIIIKKMKLPKFIEWAKAVFKGNYSSECIFYKTKIQTQ